LACSSPARTAHDPAILVASRIVNQIRRTITTARKIPGGIVNKPAVQRQSRPLLPELSELFSGFTGFPTIANLPAFASLRPFFDNHVLRLEDEMKEGLYEVRAELPGIDPIDSIEVTVRDGRLTIKAERTQTSESNGHSEFSYGQFVRTVPLPAGADEDDINATYDRGILTVSVPLAEDHPTEKHVEVVETILVDEDEEYEDEDDQPEGEDDQAEGDQAEVEGDQAEGEDVQEEHVEHEEQHQPAG
jgi:HSP20 family molecular chaperone IbpA